MNRFLGSKLRVMMHRYHACKWKSRLTNGSLYTNTVYVCSGCTDFPRTYESLQNAMLQKGDMKFHNEDTQMFGTIVENLVTRVTWRPGFARPWVCLTSPLYLVPRAFLQ
jgi:hypothetical protein